MRKTFFLLLIFSTQLVFGQLQIGGFLGTTGYIGDLNDNPVKRLKPAVGLSLGYEFNERLALRGAITFGKVEGGDKYNGSTFLKQNRNLSFTSPVTEASLVAEFTVFDLDRINWSPYVFAGLAFFHFNPYENDSGRKIYLKPLSTEGQGLPEYPDRKYYSLMQMAVPFGGGIKLVAGDNVVLGFELGIRKLFTDYLDDVSTSHVDGNILLQRRGLTAYQLSYRGDEVLGGIDAYPDNGYPQKGINRGNPKTKDWYYFTGLHVTFRLNTSGGGRGKSGYGCPNNPL